MAHATCGNTVDLPECHVDTQCLANSENRAEGYKFCQAEGECEAKAGSCLWATTLRIAYKSLHAVTQSRKSGYKPAL